MSILVEKIIFFQLQEHHRGVVAQHWVFEGPKTEWAKIVQQAPELVNQLAFSAQTAVAQEYGT